MGCDKSKPASPEDKFGGGRRGSPSRAPDPGLCAREGPGGQGRHFTDIQVDIVHSTWPLLAADMTATGISVFLDIFNNEPEVKQLFPYFSGQSPEKLAQNPRFQHHATKFMQTLSSLCDMLPHLDPDAAHSRQLMILGAQHATIPGFDIVHFSLFLKCLHVTWERALREEYTADVRNVWSIIFDFAVDRIRDGYVIYHEEHGLLQKKKEILSNTACRQNGLTLMSPDKEDNVH